MAHAIEGYSRAHTGKAIPVKYPARSATNHKTSTVKKINNNTPAAVYTASKFENVAQNKYKSTYTAQAAYTNPTLTKQQSNIKAGSESNNKTVKTTPGPLSITKNFISGISDAAKSTLKSVEDVLSQPIQTGKDLLYAAKHPIHTGEAVKVKIEEKRQEYLVGNADIKSHITGRVVGEIGFLFVGGIGKAGKAAKTAKAAEVMKVVDTTGDLAKGAKVVGEAVEAVVKVEDDVFLGGKTAKQNMDFGIISSGIRQNVFKNGELFETSIKTKNGVEIGTLAEVEISGSTLSLKNVSIYSNVGNIKNQVGAKDFLQWKNQVSQRAKEEGFTTLKIQADRVMGSSSANPGHSIDLKIDLTKLK